MKTRYETLDGLRGVAAITVLVYHFTELMRLPLPAHGYLAVDFFFVLSGFVLAASYEDRLRTDLSASKYMAVRLVRLGPMIVLGVILGGALAITWALMARDGDPATVGKEFILGLLLIPFVAPRAFMVYPLDPPSWSLASELLVNAAHAAVVRCLTTPRLGVLVVASGTVLIEISHANHGLAVGAHPSHWFWGPPRAAFSFFAGVLLFRLKDRVSFAAVRPLTLALALSICLAMPKTIWNWIYDPICAVCAFPIIVLLGSSASAPAGWLSRAAGAVSYPLYAIHYPIVMLFMWINTACGFTSGYRVLVMIPEMAAILLIAAAAMRFYETPVRQFLRRLVTEKAHPLPRTA